MTYEVYSRRNGPTRNERVVTQTRRFNGAVNEQNALIDDSIRHFGSHCQPGDRVVHGPTDVENEVSVVLITSDGRLVSETFGIRRKQQEVTFA